MTISALSSALGGMQAATTRLENAAQHIAHGGVPASAHEKADTSDAAINRAEPLFSGVLETGDIVPAVINAKLAALSYKASLNVVKATNSMFDALLDITS